MRNLYVFEFYPSCGNMGSVGRVSVCVEVGSGYEAWNRVWIFLCRWQIQVSVYCARRIPAHFRRIQCSILLHIIDICFLLCFVYGRYRKDLLCVVVGSGFVSTSSDFMRSSAIHPAGPHDRFANKTVNRPHCWGWKVSTQIVTAVAAAPLVCCVAWSLLHILIYITSIYWVLLFYFMNVRMVGFSAKLNLIVGLLCKTKKCSL